MGSDEPPVVARSWAGGEKRIGGQAAHHKEFEALELFLVPCATTGVSLLAEWYRSGTLREVSRGRPS